MICIYLRNAVIIAVDSYFKTITTKLLGPPYTYLLSSMPSVPVQCFKFFWVKRLKASTQFILMLVVIPKTINRVFGYTL